jgi:hypothetical protein
VSKFTQSVLLLAGLAVTVQVVAPTVVLAARGLTVPAVVGVVLYLAVRIVNARLGRW